MVNDDIASQFGLTEIQKQSHARLENFFPTSYRVTSTDVLVTSFFDTEEAPGLSI